MAEMPNNSENLIESLDESGLDSQNKSWPLYQQVKHLILRRIKSGHWKPGYKVPSENELVELLGISRMTVNRAIRELTTDGHLERKKGAGTFVGNRKSQFTLFELRSIADEIKSWGGNHSSQVILLQKEAADDELVEKMKLGEVTEVFHSVLVHYDNKVAIQVADRYVNPNLAKDYLKQDFSKITPTSYLLQNVPVTEIEHVIETALPDKYSRDLLKISRSEPCLILNRTTWFNDVMVTKNRFTYCGSRYAIGGRFKTSSLNSQFAV